jgi:predicted permease
MTLRYALRSLKRTPGFTIAAVLSLFLGLASVGSMFAIVYGVLLAPLPYGEPDRLVSVGLQTSELRAMGQPPALQATYQQHAQSLVGVGFYRTGNANIWREGGDDVAESVVATWVTASMMPLLQITPMLGRSFTAEEELRGGPNAAILSESEWRTRFHAAPDVLGKILMVNSVPRQIVGVMPARFSFPTAATRVWVPVKHADSAIVSDFSLGGVARLAPGASAEQAQRELAAILPRMAESYPRLDSGESTASWLAELKPAPVVRPWLERITGDISGTLWMLAAAAGLVLLVSWANVANLMLIRADGRQTELAVRAALGAGRMPVAGHFFGESLWLGAIAGTLALPAVYAAVGALVSFGPADVPRLSELHLGLPVIGFMALATLIGVMVCTAVPQFRSARASLSMRLSDGGRGQSAGQSRQRLRVSISVLQIAVALMVSLGSALLLRSAHQLSQVHPGFDATDVVTFRTQLPYARYDEADGVDFYTRLSERVRQLPSVSAVGLARKVPLGSGALQDQAFSVEGEGPALSLPMNIVDPGYFAAMRIPLLAGSHFRHDAVERSEDIVISQRAALTLFGDDSAASALGKRMTLAPSGPAYTIVGVVGDVRARELTTAPEALVYRPPVVAIDPAVEAGAPRNLALVVRSKGPTSSIVPAIRQIVRELDPAVSIFAVETMSDVLRASTARLSLMLTLMSAAAAITLLLGSIGLYGVMAYMVALRTREFGVRVALGAEPQQIARWVLKRGLALAAGGMAIGFFLYALAAPSLKAFVYGVSASDPLTLGGATLLLMAVAALASWIPAMRAARVAPAEALRAE